MGVVVAGGWRDLYIYDQESVNEDGDPLTPIIMTAQAVFALLERRWLHFVSVTEQFIMEAFYFYVAEFVTKLRPCLFIWRATE